METRIFCQSCGMPLTEEAQYASEKDGSVNQDYCIYCYKDGDFTDNMTMEEMIAFCAEHVNEWDTTITKEAAIAQMKNYFPKLKRWAKAQG